MSNSVFEAVRTVMAVREFQDREIPDDVMDRIVEAGHVSASAMNRQPWHFVVVRDRERLRELGDLVKTGPYIAGAAAAIVAAYQRASQWGVSDTSRAIQSMLITAWGEGVASNWSGGAGSEEVRRFAGLPETYEVLGVVPFGYAKQVVQGRKNRRPLAEVASAERFGTPYRT
jgi:nitroreductase